jgi:surface polysaccharide O-acyltransferase-like enzyme
MMRTGSASSPRRGARPGSCNPHYPTRVMPFLPGVCFVGTMRSNGLPQHCHSQQVVLMLPVNSKSIPLTRQAWADLCRVLAIFGVIVIHACGPTFYQYGNISDQGWLSAVLLDSLVRCSVPLFVMLSGALLLKAELKPVMLSEVARRISRVLVPLLVWNAAYLEYVSYFTGQPINWLSMLSTPPMYHLWFVYMIIGIYLIMPILQIVFEAIINRRDLQIYLLALWGIVTCLPIYLPIPLLGLLQQTSLLGYGGYFLIGAIIASSKERMIPTPLWVAIYLLSAAVTFYLTWSFSDREKMVVETAFLYFSLNVLTASIASFMVISRIQIGNSFSKILFWASDRSFLIFFMHVVVLERVNIYVASLKLNISSFILILFISAMTFMICLGIASLFRLIPKSRYLFG